MMQSHIKANLNNSCLFFFFLRFNYSLIYIMETNSCWECVNKWPRLDIKLEISLKCLEPLLGQPFGIKLQGLISELGFKCKHVYVQDKSRQNLVSLFPCFQNLGFGMRGSQWSVIFLVFSYLRQDWRLDHHLKGCNNHDFHSRGVCGSICDKSHTLTKH